MSGLDSREQQELKRRLEVLLQIPENKFCSDCNARGTGWASTNLGVFVCLRCSGIHRQMGTHISKVKSCTLDKWQPEMVETMERMGNARAKLLFEAKVPSNYPRPNGDQFLLEQWIRKKYQYREFYSEEPVQQTSAPAAPVTAQSESPIIRGASAAQTQRQPAPPQAAPQPQLALFDFLDPPSSSAPGSVATASPAQPHVTHALQMHDGWSSAPVTPTLPRAQPANSSAASLLSMSTDSFDKPKLSNQDILQMYQTGNRVQMWPTQQFAPTMGVVHSPYQQAPVNYANPLQANMYGHPQQSQPQQPQPWGF